MGVESVDGVNRNAGKMDSSLKNSTVCPVKTEDTGDTDQREANMSLTLSGTSWGTEIGVRSDLFTAKFSLVKTCLLSLPPEAISGLERR